jgi:hypothetical protein
MDEKVQITTKKVNPYQFKKGKPGGPGRPKGCRNKASLIVDEVGEKNVESAMLNIVKLALSGDFNACKYIVDRAAPPMKGRQVSFEKHLEGKTSKELGDMCSKVATMMEEGHVTPTEGLEIVGMLEKTVQVLMNTHLMVKVEEKVKEMKKDERRE